MLLHPLISQNAKSRRFKPRLGQCVFERFCCMLMYIPFFKENYDDMLSQHIKKLKKIKIIMIFVDKKIQTKNFAKSTGAAIYDCQIFFKCLFILTFS